MAADAAPIAAEPIALDITRSSTRDVEDQESALPGWTQDYRQLQAGPFEGHLLHVAADRIGLFRECTNLSLRQRTTPPPDVIVVGIPLPGAAPASFAGRPLEQNDILVLGDAAGADFLCSGAMDVMAVTLDRPYLAGHGFPAIAPLTRPANRVVHSPLAAALGQWLATLVDEAVARTGPAPALFPAAVVDRCVRALDAGTGLDPAGRVPNGRRRLEAVEKARRYAEDQVDEPLTVAQLAAAAGVSPRVLEYCFAETLGMTPQTYLRALRLNAARRDLRAADAAATVADIAMKWGFWHLGRFSTSYKAMFGESPSATLRRRR